MPLTELAVRALKPAEKQFTVWDTSLKGFGVRVGKTKKTWTVMRGENRERITIGHFPELSLSDARKKAMGVLSAETPSQTAKMTFKAAFGRYCDLHINQNLRPSSRPVLTRIFKRHFAALDSKELAAISPDDIHDIVDNLLDRPSEAVHSHRAIVSFMRWCVRRRFIDKSPCEGMAAPAKLRSRERVLTDQELKAVWKAAGKLDRYGVMIKLLILTGCRRQEIGTLQWSFIDKANRTITLPETKNGRPHTFPYGDMVAALIDTLPEEHKYCFPGIFSGKAYISWTNDKTRIDKFSGVKGYVVHDLRRTFATKLAAIGVPIYVTEALLNHKSGTISGVAAIYNRYSYEKEMREGIARYEQFLQTLHV